MLKITQFNVKNERETIIKYKRVQRPIEDEKICQKSVENDTNQHNYYRKLIEKTQLCKGISKIVRYFYLPAIILVQMSKILVYGNKNLLLYV